MPTTYKAIATVTVGSGGASSIDFTSIPATYTDLVLKFSLRNASGSNRQVRFKFNGTTSNMTYRLLYGDGSGAASENSTGIFAYSNDGSNTANTFGNGEIYIPNYAGSTNKSVSSDSVEENNATQAYSGLAANLWSDTSAITSISIIVNGGGNILQYSTATLYGIKKS